MALTLMRIRRFMVAQFFTGSGQNLGSAKFASFNHECYIIGYDNRC
jgi:hypothetical protein